MFVLFKWYRHSFAATCLSILSTVFYVGGGFMLIGYILNLDNMRRDMSLPEALLVGAVFLLIGFGCMKLAARVALNKERKLTDKNAAGPATVQQGPRPVSSGFCPKCGKKYEMGDSFCARCGTKL